MKMAPKAKLISNDYIDFAMLNYAATYSKLLFKISIRQCEELYSVV